MNLHHIKDTTCPECHSRCVREEQTHQHCNGEWFENRKFECGCVVEWVPNFSSQRIQVPCPHNIQVKAQKEAKVRLIKAVTELIEKSDCDEYTKSHFILCMPR